LHAVPQGGNNSYAQKKAVRSTGLGNADSTEVTSDDKPNKGKSNQYIIDSDSRIPNRQQSHFEGNYTKDHDR
jgi:hypothetical protein